MDRLSAAMAAYYTTGTTATSNNGRNNNFSLLQSSSEGSGGGAVLPTTHSTAEASFDLLRATWNTEAEESLFATTNNPTTTEETTPTSNDATAATTGDDDDHSDSHSRVVHNYHDHANDPDGDYIAMHEIMRKSGGSFVDQPFPVRLHYMLNEIEKDGLGHIVSWQPHGRCFVVHDQKAFTGQVLGK